MKPKTRKELLKPEIEVGVGESLSKHAIIRAQQRSISREAIAFALSFGKRVQRQSAVFYFLGKRYIPAEFSRDPKVRRWEGTTVVMSSDEESILTVYRNRAGLAAA